ncbi:MAG TPA: DUF4139 domain-containing protein [Planococcus sp. (in: firmicutes)]|nr:DUF4139 domain-containing protein [Planococcus sp. (in: firmicutes)]
MKYQSTHENRKSLGLTVYSNGFGMVKEVREMRAEVEIDEVQFLDVAEQIETDSILVRGLEVMEQNFDFDLVSKTNLLEKYVDRVVTIRNVEFQEEVRFRLLSVTDGIIGERVDTKEILVNPSGDLILPSLPDGLLLKPALIWKVASSLLSEEVSVSYLTQGLGWEANYVVEIIGEKLSLTGWIQITNRAGIHFKDASLKLIAGEVNRHQRVHAEMLYTKTEAYGDGFEERSFADYHVYSISRPITLMNEQTKQINFLGLPQAEYRKFYGVNQRSERAEIIYEFVNRSASGRGVALPKGRVKIYERDADGEMEFTGEDAIGHIPEEEKVKLKVGEAFDVVSKSWEATREKDGGFEVVTYKYKLRNRKEENIRVEIEHIIHDVNWEMEMSSHDYEVLDSKKLEFRVRLAAGKEAEIEFTYKVDLIKDIAF